MKRFIPYILIGVMVIVLLTVLNIRVAYAAENTGWQQPDTISANNCNIVPGFGDFDVTKCLAYLSFNILFRPTSAVLWFGGQILNGSVNYSLDGNTFSSAMISNGWKTVRDVVNLFFVFILLYIAIATILQITGYGIKDLLVKVIIIALLVNFSLLICKVIIDASNILALEFYNKMTVEGGTITKTLFGENARDISAVFVQGFNPQQLISSKNFQAWQEQTKGEDVAILVMFLLGSLMNLIGAFILFAGAVLFVIRIAVLWIIMMLAPLAFIAMVLPATKGYASQWWTKLFHQAFFAPAFLFLFYLVAKIVAGDKTAGQPGILETMLGSLSLKTAGIGGLQGFMASIVTILIYFTVMAVLMIACLIIAQKMGAYGASTAMNWGKKLKGVGQGYAGRIAGRTAIARPARAIAESKWAQRLATRMPKAGGAFLRTAQREAKVGGLDKITEQRVATGMTLPPEQRAKYLENLGKGLIKGKYVGVDKRSQGEMFKKMSARERVELLEKRPEFKETYERLVGTQEKPGVLLAEEREKTEKTRKEVERKGLVNNLSKKETPIEEFKSNIKLVKPEEIKELDEAIFKIRAGESESQLKGRLDAMVDNFGAGHINKIRDIGGEAESAFFGHLASLGGSVEDVANKLKERGNKSLASWVTSGPAAKSILETYGMEKKPTIYGPSGRPAT